MNERVLTVWNGLRDRWNAFDRSQKIKIIVITASVILAIGLAVFLLTRQKYATLDSNLNIATLAQIEAALEENNIPYKNTSSGLGIMVLEKDLGAAKRVYMTSSVVKSDKYKFEDAFSSMSMTTTGTMQKEALIRVEESEIQDILEGINGVNSAIVKVDLPDSSVFYIERNQEGTAQVSVNTSSQFNRKQGEVIAGIVAASFMDLPIENVTVTDQNGNYLYAGVSENSLSDTISSNQEYINVAENALTNKLKQFFGNLANEVYVSTSLDYDFTRVVTSSKEHTNPVEDGGNTGLIDREHSQSSTATNVTPEEEPGIGTNDNETPTYETQNGAQSSGSSKEKDTSYLYNINNIESDNFGYGGLKLDTSSVAVHLIRYKEYNEANITAETLNGLTWAQFKEANQNTFNEITPSDSEIQSIKNASGLTNTSLVIYEKPMFKDKEVTPIPYQTIITLLILAVLLIMLAYGLIKKTQPDEVTEIEPELSVEDLLVSTQLEEEKVTEVEKMKELAEIEFSEDSEIKKQIIKFVDEKPEAVAQLLRNWINEDWD